ncbi:MAG: phosphohistidine phosphatase SixA [Leptolyngbyaceae cyanobacterium]
MASSPLTEIFFIRHGIAAQRGTYANDDQRPLTDKGRSRTTAVAQRLVELGCHVEILLTSPLVRAQETAAILLEANLAPTLETVDLLAPGGHLNDWLPWLTDWQTAHPVSRVALVGHEPDLSSWAQLLVEGETRDRWRLKKAGVMGIEVPVAKEAIGQSTLFWFTPPRFLL